MQVDLRGRTALVTGAGIGIGRAIALAFGRCGANVVVNYSRSQAEAEEVAQEVERGGSKAVAVRADVTRWEEVQGLVSATLDAFGRLDILVNNAGGSGPRFPAQELPEEVWEQVLDLNARSVFLCCKAAIPHLPDGNGRIINVTSIAGRTGGTVGILAYAAAKGAVNAMTRNLAKELAPRGITVNAIAPGLIDTAFHVHTPPEVYSSLIKQTPLGRDGRPEDIVGAALLLASADASYITGEIIGLTGGLAIG